MLLPNRSAHQVIKKANNIGLKRDGRGRIDTLRADYFDHWTPNMTYILGFFTADGNIYAPPTRVDGVSVYKITFAQSDPYILELVCDELGISRGYIYGQQGLNALPQGGYLNMIHPMYRVMFTSKYMVERLKELGLSERKSTQLKKVSVPKKFFAHFLRGYFDGDGCLQISNNTTPSITFTGGSRQFLKSIEARISRYWDLPGGRLRPRKRNKVWDLRYRKATSLEILKRMYEGHPDILCLLTKYNKYAGVIGDDVIDIPEVSYNYRVYDTGTQVQEDIVQE